MGGECDGGVPREVAAESEGTALLCEEDRETVFVWSFEGRLSILEIFVLLGEVVDDFLGGIPEMIGGGRSRPSTALRDSCRAKSDACHHSRNFRANMEVGRRSLRLERRRGKMIDVNVAGFHTLAAWPGRAPGRGVLAVEDCSATAMAR